MAFMISKDCISCGACEPVCPNHGIRKDQRSSLYVIDSASCTESVGFFNNPQCAVACPVLCCIPDPANVHSETVLFERAKKAFHADSGEPTLTAETSHFRVAAAPKWWKRLYRLVRTEPPARDVTQPDSCVSETL